MIESKDALIQSRALVAGTVDGVKNGTALNKIVTLWLLVLMIALAASIVTIAVVNTKCSPRPQRPKKCHRQLHRWRHGVDDEFHPATRPEALAFLQQLGDGALHTARHRRLSGERKPSEYQRRTRQHA